MTMENIVYHYYIFAGFGEKEYCYNMGTSNFETPYISKVYPSAIIKSFIGTREDGEHFKINSNSKLRNSFLTIYFKILN
jgi:hypothetical protein